MKIATKIISFLFHPVLIPIMGFLILFNTGFYFSGLSWEVKWFILKAVFFPTCVMPLLTIAILALNPRFNYRMDKHFDRILPLFFSAIYYFIGFYLLKELSIYPIFKVFLLASVIVIVALMMISFRWKISNHMAGIGAITGTTLANSFRMGINPFFIIAGLFLIAGLVGTARLYLDKHDTKQVVAGYILGFTILFLAVFYT